MRSSLLLLLLAGCGQQVTLVGDAVWSPDTERELVSGACVSKGRVTAELDGCVRHSHCRDLPFEMTCHTDVVAGAVLVEAELHFEERTQGSCFSKYTETCNVRASCDLPVGAPADVVLINRFGNDIADDSLCEADDDLP